MRPEKYSFGAFQQVYLNNRKPFRKGWAIGMGILLLILLFIPWTQNIRARGEVTALRQESRPQQINTIIAGKVEKWFVKEGDFVKKGDTLLQLSEVKADYLDPALLGRTQEQIRAKQQSLNFYKGKVTTTDRQIEALQAGLEVKIFQLQNKLRQLTVKLEADSMDRLASLNDFQIAEKQYARQKTMFDSGLVSLTQLETRNQYFQQALAKKISAENKYISTLQEFAIVKAELDAVRQDNLEKVSKAEGDRFNALSQIATSEGDIAKLENLYASYAIRNGMYYVLAPQNGQVVNARASGIGEILKEGDPIVNIVPSRNEFAVQLYVRPVDLPLISQGQKVRFVIDGFPAIVFSGWPQASYGTYSGIVSAIESDISENGKFKILVKEDTSYRYWPTDLKMGTAAQGIALLKDVPIWYELWRNINSFPPDYYKANTTNTKK